MKRLHPSIQSAAEAATRSNPGRLVSVFDVHGTRYFVSPTHTEVLGYSPDELIGHHYSETVLPLDVRHARLATTDAELTGVTTPVSATLQKKSGGEVYVKGVGQRLTDPDTGEYFFLSISTIKSDANHE